MCSFYFQKLKSMPLETKTKWTARSSVLFHSHSVQNLCKYGFSWIFKDFFVFLIARNPPHFSDFYMFCFLIFKTWFKYLKVIKQYELLELMFLMVVWKFCATIIDSWFFMVFFVIFNVRHSTLFSTFLKVFD